MSQERPASRVKQYRLLTVAYAILVLFVVAGFWQSARVADDAKDLARELNVEQQRRNFALCELTNDNQTNIISVIDRMYSEELEVPGLDEETKIAREEFLEEVKETLAPTTCPPDPDANEETIEDVEENEG